MTTTCSRRWMAAPAAMAFFAWAGAASAHGDVDVERPGVEASPGSVDRPGEPRGPEAEHEERFTLGLDGVLGWGKVPFAVENLPITGTQGVTYTRQDATQSDVQSFILVGAMEVREHFGVEVRVPFTFAAFSPDGAAARATTAFGNVELAGEYSARLARGLELVAALGLALPSAQGTAIPDDLSSAPASSVNVGAFDRWSLSRAAALARGYEDNALFEPDRFGIVPKVALQYRFRALGIEPYVKVENLIGTKKSLDASYVGELVGGLRVGYWVHPHLEVAVRGWINGGFSGASEDKTTAAAVEPQVLARFGPIKPYLGVIVPVAGPPSDASFFGVRLGIAGRF